MAGDIDGSMLSMKTSHWRKEPNLGVTVFGDPYRAKSAFDSLCYITMTISCLKSVPDVYMFSVVYYYVGILIPSVYI